MKPTQWEPEPTDGINVVSRPMVPDLSRKLGDAGRDLVTLTDERGLVSEKFRMLANRILSMRLLHPLKVVQVTSSVPAEGKSMVACNLAITLARRSNTRVLLVDGDLRKPSLAGHFGIEQVAGLGEWLNDGAGQGIPQMVRLEELGLSLVMAGDVRDPVGILQSPRMPELLLELKTAFDWIVVDSPPLLPFADASLWARWVDGTLVVVRAGVPSKKALQKGLESLDKARLLGVVLNEGDEDRALYPYYQHYYDVKVLPPAKPNRPLLKS